MPDPSDASHHADVIALHPPSSSPRGAVPVRGLYLDGQLSALRSDAPLIYANFVTSLDGRIALGSDEQEAHVPQALTTAADWRLFQELQAHADCFIVHGAYLRALAAGRLGDILQVGLRAESADLLGWRAARGASHQPSIVVASASLDFELPISLTEHQQQVIVVTTADAPAHRLERLRERGVRVRVDAARGKVSAAALIEATSALGCQRTFLQAGPAILTDMLRGGHLHKLYLTLGHRLLGGEAYRSLVEGTPLGAAGALRLQSLYWLAETPAQDGQFFASFEPRARP
ncbi:MAG: dihydrofolate reductase family protein [Pseudomonadota bacterium]